MTSFPWNIHFSALVRHLLRLSYCVLLPVATSNLVHLICKRKDYRGDVQKINEIWSGVSITYMLILDYMKLEVELIRAKAEDISQKGKF